MRWWSLDATRVWGIPNLLLLAKKISPLDRGFKHITGSADSEKIHRQKWQGRSKVKLVSEALNRAEKGGALVFTAMEVFIKYASKEHSAPDTDELGVLSMASIAAGIEATTRVNGISDAQSCRKAEGILMEIIMENMENTDLEKLDKFLSLFPELR